MRDHVVLRPRRPHVSPIWRELRGACGLLLPAAGPPPGVWPRRDDGPPVVLVPGFLAGDWSLQPLAAQLAGSGFRPVVAGIERNVDCSEATAARLVRVLDELGEPAALVGHCRGGLLARVVARRRPQLVDAVITLASPYRDPYAIHPILLAQGLLLGLAGTVGVPGLMRISCAVGACCACFRKDLAAPAAASVPHVSVYSRRDAVIDWRACVDGSVEAIEVDSSHCGMAADDAAVRRVVDRLCELQEHRLSPTHMAALAA